VGLRSILVLDSYSTSIGGTQAAYRMVGATVDPALQIGSAFPIADEPSSNRTQSLQNSTIVRWGNYIYAQVNSSSQARLYRYDVDNPSADWVLYKTITATMANGTKHCKGPLHIMMLGGVPHLVGVVGNTSNQFVAFKVNLLTDAISNTSSFGSFGASIGMRNNIIYKGRLFIQGESTRPYYYDPLNHTSAQTGGTTVDMNRTTFVVYDNRLLWINSSGSPAVLTIYELDETTLSWGGTVYTTSVSVHDGSSHFTHSRWAAWVAPGKTNAGGQSLWMITNSRGAANNNPTWQLHEFFFEPTSVFTTTDWSSALPATLLNNGPGAQSAVTGSSKWRPFMDNETTPGSPIVNLFFSSHSDTGGILSRYIFDPTGPTLTLMDVGPANSGWFQCPHDNTYGAGDRFWVPGQPTIKIMTHAPLGDGHQRVTFIASSPDPSSPIDVELYYVDNSEVAIYRGSLSDPTEGTIASNTGGDYISGITADGVTEHEVTWLASDDGVTELSFVEIVLRAVM
jgi:hypothetical protein